MENQFFVKDVVWARARNPRSEIFWPAQVIETTTIPKRSIKKIIASVRFLGENTEDDVKDPKDIKKWDCKEQDSYIQKGRSSLKDSNSRIAFNKGVKEGRELFNQNMTSRNEGACLNAGKNTEANDSSSSKDITFVNDQSIPHSVNKNSDTNCENSDAQLLGVGKSCNKQSSRRGQKRQTSPRKRSTKRKTSEQAPIQCSENSQKNNEQQQTPGETSQEKSENVAAECYGGEESTINSKQTGKRKRNHEKEHDESDCVNSDHNYSLKQCTGITRKSPRKVTCLSSSTKIPNPKSTDNIATDQTFQKKATLRKSPRNFAEKTHDLQRETENKNTKTSKKSPHKGNNKVNKTEQMKESKPDSNNTKNTKATIGRKRKKDELIPDKKEENSSNQYNNLKNETPSINSSKSLDNLSTSKQKPTSSTEPKRRKRLFAENEKTSSTSTCGSQEGAQSSTEADAHYKEDNNQQDDSDSEESSDQELMETALSPNSKNAKFQINDIVWAKFYREAYWPAQVKRIQKKPKKIYVKFLGSDDKRCFACYKMCSFACDSKQREEYIKSAEKQDASNFQKAFTEAEDLVRKKALGISIEPEDDIDDYEDAEMVDNEETKDVDVAAAIPPSTEQNETGLEDKQDVRRSKRSKKQISKYNQGMLSYIREAKPMLKDIIQEKVQCERHSKFKNGRTKEKSALKRQSGFGPITDSDLESDIIELLVHYYNECVPEKSNLSGLPYVLDVWLPEAIIYAIQKIDRVDRKTAETTYSQGSVSQFDHAQLMHQLKSKELTDEDRQASLQRAERAMQKMLNNSQNS